MLIACGDLNEPLSVEPPLFDQEPADTMCPKSDPCDIDGIWVTVEKNEQDENEYVPCTETSGGCFPQNDSTPVVWGDTLIGGWGVDAKEPGWYHSDDRAPDSVERADLDFAIKNLRCKIGSEMTARLRDGRIRIVPTLGGYFAEYIPADETIYIAQDKHWYVDPNDPDQKSQNVFSFEELVDTVAHEGVHVWFGVELTDDDDPDAAGRRDDAISECV